MTYIDVLWGYLHVDLLTYAKFMKSRGYYSSSSYATSSSSSSSSTPSSSSSSSIMSSAKFPYMAIDAIYWSVVKLTRDGFRGFASSFTMALLLLQYLLNTPSSLGPVPVSKNDFATLLLIFSVVMSISKYLKSSCMASWAFGAWGLKDVSLCCFWRLLNEICDRKCCFDHCAH